MEVAALAQQLRAASTAKAQHQAIDACIELLISTPSLASSQQIVSELGRLASKCGTNGSTFSQKDFILRLKQAAAVCSSPVSKAEYLGFALLDQIFRSLMKPESNNVAEIQELLLDVYNGNPDVVRGVFAALESKQSPFFSPSAATMNPLGALKVVSPLFVLILASTKATSQVRLALLHTLQRIAWQSGQESIATAVASLLVVALGVFPRSVDAIQSYVVLVSVLADLLVSSEETVESTRMIATTCTHVIGRMRFYAKNQVGVLQSMQALEQLASFAPDALWSSRFLFSCGHALVASYDSHLEKQSILNILSPVLRFGKQQHEGNPVRRVYVECLILPLISVLSTHPDEAPRLLQLVMDLRAEQKYVPSREAASSEPQDAEDEDSCHSVFFLDLIDREELCVNWLVSLFTTTEGKSSGEKKTQENTVWLFLSLGTLLFEERSALRDQATMALERQVQRDIKYWPAATTKLLVSSLVFLVCHCPTKPSAPIQYAAFMTKCVYVLGSLAATTTDTMKIILRLIKRMNSVVQLQPMALKILYAVWERESRVYPRLEALLHQELCEEAGTEHQIVRMATIDSLCGKDPEAGVEYISQIQACLEAQLVSVVAMAINAIGSLCKADCLDFYAAFKIIALKMKKKKIQCADDPLFREELCVFYSLGVAEMDSNKKQTAKLLDQLWELTEDGAASVRKRAFESLNAYPLVSLGLCVQDRREAMAVNSHDEDSEDEITEEDVGEKLDELLHLLKSEESEDVRFQIERLLTRVLEYESAKINSGRGQPVISSTLNEQRQQRVSAAATKELKKHFPPLQEITEICSPPDKTVDWDAFLLAYETEKIEFSSVKRKDKLVKLATQNVTDMEETMVRALSQQVAPWESTESEDIAFLRIQTVMESWQAFVYKYVNAVENLSALKLTTGADIDTGNEHFAEHVMKQVEFLQDHSDGSKNELLCLIAVGALVGQLRDSIRWASSFVQKPIGQGIDMLNRRLARAVEEVKVFPDKNHHKAVISAVVGLHLAFGRRFADSEKETLTEASLKRTEATLQNLIKDTNHTLIRGVSLGALSHIGSLYSQSTASMHEGEKRLKCVAGLVLDTLLRISSEGKHCDSVVKQCFSTIKGDGSPVGSLHSLKLPSRVLPKPDDVVVVWASLMALVRLSPEFARIQRLRWLWNLKLLLSHFWCASTDASSGIFGIALGPVLLECIKCNLMSAAEGEEFAAKCFERLKSRSKRHDQGFLLISLHYMLSRMPAQGGFIHPDESKLLVEESQQVIWNEQIPDFQRQLAIASVADYFHQSFGVCNLSVGLVQSAKPGSVETNAEPNDVKLLVEMVRSAAAGNDSGIGRFVLSAIAVTKDLFCVVQKKKTFDAEILSLPSSGLLFKIMDSLRQKQTSKAIERDEGQQPVAVPASVSFVKSLLSCMTATAAVLPSLDFESLVHRLIKRFCNDEVTIASIRFAMTQGVCDVYAIQTLYARDMVINLDRRIQRELISGIVLLGKRISRDNLESLLSISMDLVIKAWQVDARDDQSILLVEAWIDTLGKLSNSGKNGRVSSESREMVRRLVTQQFLPSLPLTQHDGPVSSKLLCSFTQQVLVHLDGLDEYLLGSSSQRSAYQAYQWWQRATIFVELLRSGVVFAADKQSSFVLQWVLRQDFSRWHNAPLKIRVQILYELSSFVSIAGSDEKQSHDTISWLLEAIAALSRSFSSSSSEESVTRQALFTFLTGIFGWNCTQSYEQHVALSLSPDALSVSSFASIFPIGLLRALGVNSDLNTVVERLWSLFELVRSIESRTKSSIDYSQILRAASRQALIETSVQVSPHVKQSILHFCSLDGFK
ncbi:Armadillo-type fold, partial [Globisporangium splendens]